MLSFLVTLLLFILIVGLVVMVQECGHFIAARLTGMEVEEFSIGMGPKVWSKKRGDTEYMLKLFPIGGYVKILGEEEEVRSKRSFSEKPVWARMCVACAGVIMNAILGAFVFYIVLFSQGFVYDGIPYYEGFTAVFGRQEVVYAYPVTVVGIVEDSPAEVAGIESGWEILRVEGEAVETTEDVKSIVTEQKGESVAVDFRTVDDEERTVEIGVADDGTMGVQLASDFQVVKVHYEGVNRVFAGFLHEVNMMKANVFILVRLVSQSIEERTVTPVAQSVAGPVGLFAVIDIVKKYGGVIGMIDLIGMFNVALVMMNILPFPALDGGHVLFLGIEGIRGKPVNRKLQQGLFTAGMMMLFLFMIVVSAKDIFQFGVWDWVKGLFGA